MCVCVCVCVCDADVRSQECKSYKSFLELSMPAYARQQMDKSEVTDDVAVLPVACSSLMRRCRWPNTTRLVASISQCDRGDSSTY